MNILYSYLWDFIIMGLGILLMYLLRTINYSNKKIHILTKLSYYPIKEYESLVITYNNYPSTIDELLIQNNKDSTTIENIYISKNIQFFDQYFYSGEKNIYCSVLDKYSKDLSIILNTKVEINENTKLPYLFITNETKRHENNHIFILFKELSSLKIKCCEFDKEASLLVWHIMHSEVRYIKI